MKHKGNDTRKTTLWQSSKEATWLIKAFFPGNGNCTIRSQKKKSQIYMTFDAAEWLWRRNGKPVESLRRLWKRTLTLCLNPTSKSLVALWSLVPCIMVNVNRNYKRTLWTFIILILVPMCIFLGLFVFINLGSLNEASRKKSAFELSSIFERNSLLFTVSPLFDWSSRLPKLVLKQMHWVRRNRVLKFMAPGFHWYSSQTPQFSF